jgi:hypothetical protein
MSAKSDEIEYKNSKVVKKKGKKFLQTTVGFYVPCNCHPETCCHFGRQVIKEVTNEKEIT